ncbi:hypothetical protein TNCV_1335291 [Trichonephila clavipes]|nr:hypothetical protein TNCV_1335291 [Trichonephila clavipes]
MPLKTRRVEDLKHFEPVEAPKLPVKVWSGLPAQVSSSSLGHDSKSQGSSITTLLLLQSSTSIHQNNLAALIANPETGMVS